MTKIYCGCSDLPHNRKDFYKTCSAIEYRVGLFSPPKARVLKSWAEAAQESLSPMRSVWVAWQAFTHRPADIHKGFGLKLLDGESPANLGYFKKTPENLRVWTRIKEQAIHVGASRILLETPAHFTPSDENKRALADFANDWADLPENTKLVWHPAGFWEREESAAIAQQLGMILAIDPLVDEREGLPEGNEAYFQMLGRHGLLDSYSDDDEAAILDAASRYDECTIVFRTRDSLADAKRLMRLAESYVPDGAFGAYDEDEWDDEDFDDDFDDETSEDDDIE